jgi:hypothetical protein
MAIQITITSIAGALDSMCVEPFLVPEERAKQQRNLPMMISFGARRKRAGIAQNVAPMLNKVRCVVERMLWRRVTSNRRHGGHLCRSPGDADDGTSMLLRVSESLVNIAHFQKLMPLSRAKPFSHLQDFRQV